MIFNMEVKFGTGEYLTSVVGRIGDFLVNPAPYVVFLTFHTNKTIYGPYGNKLETRQNFEFSPREGRIISGFHGRKLKSGFGLSAIGIFEKDEAAKTKEDIAKPSGPDLPHVTSTSGAKHNGISGDRPRYQKACRTLPTVVLPAVDPPSTVLQPSIVVENIVNALGGDSANPAKGSVHFTLVNNIISNIPLHSHSVFKSMLEGRLNLGSPSEIEALHQSTSSEQDRILHHLCTTLCSSFYNGAKARDDMKTELDKLRNEKVRLQDEKTKVASERNQADQRAMKAEEDKQLMEAELNRLRIEKNKLQDDKNALLAERDQADKMAMKAEEDKQLLEAELHQLRIDKNKLQLLMEAFDEAKIDLAVRAVNRYKRSPAFDAFMHQEFIDGIKQCKKSVEEHISKEVNQLLESFIADMVEKGRQTFRDNKKLWRAHCRYKELPILDMHLDLPDNKKDPRFYAHIEGDSMILLDDPEDEGPDENDPELYHYMSEAEDNIS